MWVVVSAKFANTAEWCKEQMQCKDTFEIAFVKQIATLADASLAYTLAEHSCVARELKSVISLKSDLLLPRALAETRTFAERVEVLRITTPGAYRQALCFSLIDEASEPEDFLLLRSDASAFCDPCEVRAYDCYSDWSQLLAPDTMRVPWRSNS